MNATIVVLPGDGIGPEITDAATAVLRTVASRCGHRFVFKIHLIGAASLRETGESITEEALEACLNADAVLVGAVGDARYDKEPRNRRPEGGLLALRQRLGAFAYLRPVVIRDQLISSSPLRPELARGVDLIFVRELFGGILFGEPRELSQNRGLNTMVYTTPEVERIARTAFSLAMRRRRKVTSVDKANVLEASQLWRRVVSHIGEEYPSVELRHEYVDNCAMSLVCKPASFDVILTENLFGDILSDEGAMLTGSLGLTPSAAIGGRTGLFETSQGSQTHLAGMNSANPVGAIASAALLLRHGLDLTLEASAVEAAVNATLDKGYGTADLPKQPFRQSTAEFGAQVCAQLGEDCRCVLSGT